VSAALATFSQAGGGQLLEAIAFEQVELSSDAGQMGKYRGQLAHN